MRESVKCLTLILDSGLDTDDEDLEKLTRSLRANLLELDVVAVNLGEKETPEGSKVSSAIDWTMLLITLGSSSLLTAIISAVQAWLLRNQKCSITLKIGDDQLVVTGAGPYSEEQKQAIEKWQSRHKGFLLTDE